MATRIRGISTTTLIRVGDPLTTPLSGIAFHYILLKWPDKDAPIRILQPWWCPNCAGDNWARIVIARGVVESIESVELAPEEVATAHFIAQDVAPLFESLTGESIWNGDKPRPDAQKLLIDALTQRSP